MTFFFIQFYISTYLFMVRLLHTILTQESCNSGSKSRNILPNLMHCLLWGNFFSGGLYMVGESLWMRNVSDRRPSLVGERFGLVPPSGANRLRQQAVFQRWVVFGSGPSLAAVRLWQLFSMGDRLQ